MNLRSCINETERCDTELKIAAEVNRSQSSSWLWSQQLSLHKVHIDFFLLSSHVPLRRSKHRIFVLWLSLYEAGRAVSQGTNSFETPLLRLQNKLNLNKNRLKIKT